MTDNNEEYLKATLYQARIGLRRAYAALQDAVQLLEEQGYPYAGKLFRPDLESTAFHNEVVEAALVKLDAAPTE